MYKAHLLLVLMMSMSLRLPAQSITGAIFGTVVDAAGRPVRDVDVVLSGPFGERRLRSGADGSFRLSELHPAEYSVGFTKVGWSPAAVTGITIGLGRTTRIEPVVLMQQVTALDPVLVRARRPQLDPTSTEVGSTISMSEYSALPGARDYTSLLSILPHTSESFRGDPVNVAGATGLENVYFVDGVNVTAPLHAQEGTRLPYNFLRQVEVKVGGYGAQHGKALGAIVNAVTYTGTNNFEAEIFAFGTNGSLSTDPKTMPTLRETGSFDYDFGGRIGGPIVRDRLWYSAGYNPQIRRADRAVADLGNFVDRKTAHLYAAKLTWLPSQRGTVEISLFGDPTVHNVVAVPGGIASTLVPLNADPYLKRIRTGGAVAALRSTISFDPGTVFTVSISRSANKDSQDGQTETGRTQPVFNDNTTRTMSGGIGFFDISDGRRTAARLELSLNRARHDAVAGASFEDASVTRRTGISGGRAIARETTGEYTGWGEGSFGEVHNKVITAYAQESWHPTAWLSINPGVRWSSQRIVGASGTTAHIFRSEVQPRLGAVLRFGAKGRERVVGSVGRYYQELPLNLASLWFVDGFATGWAYDGDPRQAGTIETVFAEYSSTEEEFARATQGRRAEHTDEMTLGYERLLNASTTLTVRGIQRNLRSSFQWGFGPTGVAIGTPGEGDFDFLPRPRRRYRALELGVEGSSARAGYRASYVLSRSEGNYTGLFASDFGFANPGGNAGFIKPHQSINTDGLLPNDHPHVFKLAVWRRMTSRITTGTVFSWQSGAPLNELAPGPGGSGDIAAAFTVPRGSAGRTPQLWDLNLRAAFEPRGGTLNGSRFVLDLLHVGNPQKAVTVNEYRYLRNEAGVFSSDNPDYRQPTQYQPPMMARIGIEIGITPP